MEKARAGSELFLHGAFLRAVEIWDVRIGVYNIRSMAGNAIMNGETRYLTEKEAVRTVDCWGPIPQETAMRSFYLQCMRFFARCQCAKGKMFRLFPERGGGGAPFLGAARSGKAVCFMQRRGKRDVPAVSRAWRRGRAVWGLRGAGKLFALCSGAGKGTFRLFPERGDALNACGAFNFAAVLWKFARKSARPPDWFRDAWRKIESSRPCCFPVRAGGETDEGYSQR